MTTDENAECPKCGSTKTMPVPDSESRMCYECQHEFVPENPFVPRRVFISYGHDEHVSLALRLRDDLKVRGHDAWFDEDRLKPGYDWEAGIEEGLQWAADAKPDAAVLLLLTPHSVRRPDGYCLNEVARALALGLDIIPLMVVESEPPLSICRIQWLDMRPCIPIHEKEKIYETKFERLLKALEKDELDFEGSQQYLLKHLQPLDFETDILQHLEHFIGRQWIFDAINSWLDEPENQRVFWITGEAGAGKTALCAQMIQEYPEIGALHLCKFGHAQKSSPRRVVTSLAYQITTQLPDYESALASRDLSDLTEDDARTMFDNLIVQPLCSIGAPDSPVLILIDALDEATREGHNALASFIAAEFPKTPDWLRLILTSRPDETVLLPLQRLDSFVLNTATEANMGDIRDYLARELAPQIADRADGRETIEEIVSHSEGLFLYAERMCRDVREGNLSLDHVDEFPRSLGESFWQNFERLVYDPERRPPGPDLDRYRRKIRPALRAILAAEEPLPVKLLGSLLGWQEEEQADFTRMLGSLFPRSDRKDQDVIQPYHEALAEWLTDRKKAGPYFVSRTEGHRMLADEGCAQYQRGVDRMANYFLVHLPAHLASCKDWDRLVKVLCAEDFVRRRAEGGPASRHMLSEDYRVALTLLPATHLPFLWQGPEICVQYALAGISATADQGELDQCRELLGVSEPYFAVGDRPKLSSLWHCTAGRIALYEDRYEKAETYLSRSLDLARQASFEEGAAKALLTVGTLIRKWGQEDSEAFDALSEALASDFSTYDPDFRCRVLLNLSMVHMRRREIDKAAFRLDQAEVASEESGNAVLAAWHAKYCGFLRLLQGCYDKARENFSAGREAFADIGNLREAERCRNLSICALIPVVCYQAKNQVSKTVSNELEREVLKQADNLQLDLRSIMSDASKADGLARDAQRLCRLVRQSERAHDPEPPLYIDF